MTDIHSPLVEVCVCVCLQCVKLSRSTEVTVLDKGN